LIAGSTAQILPQGKKNKEGKSQKRKRKRRVEKEGKEDSRASNLDRPSGEFLKVRFGDSDVGEKERGVCSRTVNNGGSVSEVQRTKRWEKERRREMDSPALRSLEMTRQ